MVNFVDALIEKLTHLLLCSIPFSQPATDCRGTEICSIERVSKTVLRAAPNATHLSNYKLDDDTANLIPCAEETIVATMVSLT